MAYIQAPKRYGYSYLRRASVHIHDACAFTHGTIYLDNGASLIVEKNAVFNFTDTADYLRSSNNHIGHFNNHGTFNAMRQGSIIIMVTLNNYGNINVANGSTLDIRTSSTSTGTPIALYRILSYCSVLYCIFIVIERERERERERIYMSIRIYTCKWV